MKILFVQMSWLGDSVLSTAVLSSLIHAQPNDQIDVLCTPGSAPLFRGIKGVNAVIEFDKRKTHSGIKGSWRIIKELRARSYQKVYSMHRSGRTAVVLWAAGIPDRVGFAESALSFLYQRRKKRPKGGHEVERNLSLLNGEIPAESICPDLSLSADPPENAQPEVLNMGADPRLILMFPSSAWPTKRWFGEGYRHVAEHFAANGYRVVLLGSANEREYHQKFFAGSGVEDWTGNTSLAETAYLVSRARFIFCNDSLALHLSSAFKRPNIVVYCATSPSFGFGPWQNPFGRIIEKEGLPCKPCRRHGGLKCPTGTEACMRTLDPGDVVALAEKVLSESNGSVHE